MLRLLLQTFCAGFLLLAIFSPGARLHAADATDEQGATVLLVYNSAMPESRTVADSYARKRHVPSDQILGLDLPLTEAISRADFIEKLQQPLWQEIQKRKLLSYSEPVDLSGKATQLNPDQAKIRYLVLCYGIPVKVTASTEIKEEPRENLPAELQRNEAAVDTELALLPLLPRKLPLAGPIANPSFAATNSLMLSPTNGVLMVARLDGPTPEIAKGLVDKALEAERDGLWGRAYIDTRGLTNGPYQLGDDWLRLCGEVARRFGFETVIDKTAGTFGPAFPMSQIGLYFGWYEGHVNGPFNSRMAEFMPGAVAYHLHSFSAQVLRSDSQCWVGPLLARGATATMGCTEEPYLQFTPDLPIFLDRLLRGFSFGEAAYAAQRSLSWQVTVVGDPLYRPFAKQLQQRVQEQTARKDKLIEWSHLLVVNRHIAMDAAAEDVTSYFSQIPETEKSALLQEKLGDYYKSRGKILDCIDPYLRALELEPTSVQRARISVGVGTLLANFGRNQEAYDIYKNLLRDVPDYPGKPEIYRKLATIAAAIDKKEEAAEFEKLANSTVSGS